MVPIKLPKGFLANGIHCGLKKKRKDLSLFYSKKACICAALFTTNAVKAAPVILGQRLVKKHGAIRAILVNSGNANCMTGKRGLDDAKKMVRKTAAALNIPKNTVLVSSTGIIGKPMHMGPIMSGMSKLVRGLSPDGLIHAAEGIMTTDRFYKVSTRRFVIGDRKVTMVGVAKGAGMVNPNMATILGYVLTDADISEKALNKALLMSNEISFNSITVDGDMSTNDTVVLLANGEAGNRSIKGKGRDFDIFLDNLNGVMLDLAKMIVRDGEGATKFFEVKVREARTKAEAKKAADAIANSILMKCAVLGGDPNWGRVASSIGASGIRFDPDRMDVKLDGVMFLKKGKVVSLKKEKVRSVFKKKDADIEVNLHLGDKEAAVYTCDISKRYITLNALYTT